MVEFFKNLSVTNWISIVAILVSILIAVFPTIIKNLHKVKINLSLKRFYIHNYEKGKNFIFELLISNHTNEPISIKNILLKNNKMIYRLSRPEIAAMDLYGKDIRTVCAQFSVPFDANEHKSKFIIETSEKKFTFSLITTADN